MCLSTRVVFVALELRAHGSLRARHAALAASCGRLPQPSLGASVRRVVRVLVGIDPRALCGTDAAVDRLASAARYVERLREGLTRELPDVAHEVSVGTRFVRVEGLEGAEAARLRAHVEAVADAVRHCGDWVVYE